MAVDQERYQQAERDRATRQRETARDAFREAGEAISRKLGVRVATDRLEVEELQELRSLVARVTHVDEQEIGTRAVRRCAAGTSRSLTGNRPAASSSWSRREPT